MEEVLLFKVFCPIADTCLSCEDRAQQSCAMVSRWRILGPAFPARHVQDISDMHSKFALRPHHMCGSMVHMQSATAEIMSGKKKKKERRIETTGQKYSDQPYSIARP